VQDLGRVGQRAIGVGSGGALDAFAARIANLLVGNDESAAIIEIALGNFRIQFHDERLIAWCGASFEVNCAGKEIPAGHAFLVTEGEAITVANPEFGCRAWLAISGGVDVPIVLGSRSTDLRAGFGGFNGRALRDGDELALGVIPAASLNLFERLRNGRSSDWSAPREWGITATRHPLLRFIRGADWDCFNPSTHHLLVAQHFVVTPEADRMGIRFEGPELKRNDTGDFLSQAVAPGTMQVPPNGKAILLLGDCQTIGGYPKIAHVVTVDHPIAAQLRPEDEVRFEEISLAEAHSLLAYRANDLARFRIGLSLKRS